MDAFGLVIFVIKIPHVSAKFRIFPLFSANFSIFPLFTVICEGYPRRTLDNLLANPYCTAKETVTKLRGSATSLAFIV